MSKEDNLSYETRYDPRHNEHKKPFVLVWCIKNTKKKQKNKKQPLQFVLQFFQYHYLSLKERSQSAV